MKAHQRKNGLWEAKGYQDGRRKSFYASTKEQAEKLASQPRDQNTLGGYFEHVFVPSILHTSYNTRKLYASAFDKWWLPYLGHVKLSEIKRSDVQRIANLMTSYSSGTRSQYVTKLSKVMDLAVADGVISSNPVKYVRNPRVEYEKKVPLKPWELKSLLESVDGGMWNAVVLMGFFGMRVGEACGLVWGDVSDRIEVRRQYPSRPLKTESSRRDLPIPESCEFRKEGLRVVGYAPATVYAELHKLGFSSHGLRHTFTTILEWELQCPRPVITALLGHSGAVTDVYSHPDPEVLRGWLERYWTHVCSSTTLSLSYQPSKDRLA